MAKANQAKVQGAVKIVLAAAKFPTEAAMLAEVSACVTQSETVKGKWQAMVAGCVAFCGNDRAKIVAYTGDGDGNKHSDKLEKAVIAGLPALSRTLLETARSDTAEENKDARDAAQANVATYIRRIRQGCFDILEGKKKTERSDADNMSAAADTADRLVKQLQKINGKHGNVAENLMLAGFIAASLRNGSPVAPNVIGMAAMLQAKKSQ